jgi:hypothetical protein
MRIPIVAAIVGVQCLSFPLVGVAQTVWAGADEPVGLLTISPDSVTRNLYKRTRVRSIAKVRLNGEGDVRDTVSYQEVDTAGRFLRLDTYLPPHAHQQWSYDAQGHCVSLVLYPTPNSVYSYIFNYNPELGSSTHQGLRPNGKLFTISETTLEQRADTLIKETRTQRTLTGEAVTGLKAYQRITRYTPHPDTVLLLHSWYAYSGQLLSNTATYRLSRQGRLYETGELDLAKAARLQKISAFIKFKIKTLTYHQLVSAMRQTQGIIPRQWWRYDIHNRVVQHTNRQRLNQQGQFSETMTRYSYNSIHQMIGSEITTFGLQTPTQTSYTVFSYLPSGLLQGETSNARSEKPVFYRYLYQYHE